MALAAQLLDVEATVVMPEEAPRSKVAAAEGYDATVVQHGHGNEELRERARALIEAQGYTMVNPFADRAIIAGQGTLGLELSQQGRDIDLVIGPVGGGGLAAGVATAFSGPDSDVTVLGVETVGTAHAGPAIERGEVVMREEIDTIAEGITAGRTEPLALAPLRECVDEVVSVSDEAAKEAMAVPVARAKTVVEPASALPVAAVLSGTVDVTEKRVVAVIAGGNVDLADFCESATAGERNLSLDG